MSNRIARGTETTAEEETRTEVRTVRWMRNRQRQNLRVEFGGESEVWIKIENKTKRETEAETATEIGTETETEDRVRDRDKGNDRGRDCD